MAKAVANIVDAASLTVYYVAFVDDEKNEASRECVGLVCYAAA